MRIKSCQEALLAVSIGSSKFSYKFVSDKFVYGPSTQFLTFITEKCRPSFENNFTLKICSSVFEESRWVGRYLTVRFSETFERKRMKIKTTRVQGPLWCRSDQPVIRSGLYRNYSAETKRLPAGESSVLPRVIKVFTYASIGKSVGWKQNKVYGTNQ